MGSRPALGALMVAVLLSAAIADAQQLTFETHVEMRDVPLPQPANRIEGEIIHQAATMLAGMFNDNFAEPKEFTSVLGDQGMRVTYTKGGPALLRDRVAITRLNGETFVLDAKEHSYWGFRLPGAPPGQPAPEIALTHTGEFDTIAGIRAERVTYEVKIAPAAIAAIEQQLGTTVRVGLRGEAWIATQFRKYSSLLQQRDRLTDATARSLAPLQSEGLVLRWIMRGEVLNGHEIELLVTALSEGPATPELFQIPADFHAVAPPASPSPPGASTSPTLITRVNPTYTQDAMRAKIQGSVRLEVVVLADGTVGDVRVIESLDKQYGLDQQAINAAKQWRFNPARRNGQPVPAQVAIVLEFKLHN